MTDRHSPTSTPLLIAGFHRSGTSLCAQVLSEAGLYLGERLLGANPSNPYGHFEDEEIVQFHERLLGSAGHAWFLPRGPSALSDPTHADWAVRFLVRRAALGRTYGFKDPRLCLTLRFWSAMLPQLHVLYVHRSPRHCVTSMWQRAWTDVKTRHALEVNEALIADKDLIARIYVHNLVAFLSARAARRRGRDRIVVVSYDDIVAGRIDLPRLVNRRFGLDLDPIDFGSVYDADVVTADRSPLRLAGERERELDQLDRTLRALCVRDAEDEADAGADPDPFAGMAAFAEPAVDDDVLAYELAVAERRLRGCEQRIKTLEADRGQIEAELDAMQTRVDEMLAGAA